MWRWSMGTCGMTYPSVLVGLGSGRWDVLGRPGVRSMGDEDLHILWGASGPTSGDAVDGRAAG